MFAHLEFQLFIGQVLGLSVLSLELTKTHCLLNGVLDVSLGFIVLPLVHALCRSWAGSELALLDSLSEMLILRMSGGMMPIDVFGYRSIGTPSNFRRPDDGVQDQSPLWVYLEE